MSTRDHHHSSRPHRHRSSDSRSRSRSRSPDRTRTDRPDRHRRHHHHRHHRRHRDDDEDNNDERKHRSHRPREHRHHRRAEVAAPPAPSKPVVLPLHARELTKRDLSVFEPMFAMYLDIQKGIILEELSADEVKGRWKSFVGKWNRGELAEGWYDPSTLEKARLNAPSQPPAPSEPQNRGSPDYDQGGRREDRAGALETDPKTREPETNDGADLEDDDDDYGPTLPLPSRFGGQAGQSSGPSIPTMQDLELRKESAMEDAIAAREDAHKYRRAELQSHRSEMRHIEDEIAPRAEPGTHERRMEKRAEAAAANRAFASNQRGGSPTDAAPDDELMGSGTNDLDAIKNSQEREQRKKNEREIRREEIMRARAAEREERLQQYRQKEDETIGWLKTLAKQRFG